MFFSLLQIMIFHCYRVITPVKTNMSPQNQWLEDVFPTKIVPNFLGGHVRFPGCNILFTHRFPGSKKTIPLWVFQTPKASAPRMAVFKVCNLQAKGSGNSHANMSTLHPGKRTCPPKKGLF